MKKQELKSIFNWCRKSFKIPIKHELEVMPGYDDYSLEVSNEFIEIGGVVLVLKRQGVTITRVHGINKEDAFNNLMANMLKFYSAYCIKKGKVEPSNRALRL